MAARYVSKFADATRGATLVMGSASALPSAGSASLSTLSNKAPAPGQPKQPHPAAPAQPPTGAAAPPPKKGGSSLPMLALLAIGGGTYIKARYPEEVEEYTITLKLKAEETANFLGISTDKLPWATSAPGQTSSTVLTKEAPVDDHAGWQLEPVGGPKEEEVCPAPELLQPVAAAETEAAPAEPPAAGPLTAVQPAPTHLDAAPLDALLTEALKFGSDPSTPAPSSPSPPSPAPSTPAPPPPAALDAQATAASDAAAAAVADTALQALDDARSRPAPSPVPAPAPVPALPRLPPPTPGTANPPALAHPANHLGVRVDLTPGGLVRFAVDNGYGAGADWTDYTAQHRQAKADAAAIATALQQAESYLEQQLSQERQVAEELRAEVAAVRAKSAEESEALRGVLRQRAEAHRQEVAQAVKLAQLGGRLAASEAGAKERLARLKALDEVRLKSGALAVAMQQREEALSAAVGVGRLSVALGSMQAALQTGAPLSQVAAAAAGGDELVEAAVGALPGGVLKGGAASREELGAKFRALSGPLAEMGQLPEGTTGMLAVLAAKVASMLKVSEKEAVGVLGYDSAQVTPSIALAAAEQLLDEGKIREAADVLDTGLKGTAAAPMAAGWIAAARERAAVEVAVKLLQSHSAAVMAALS